MHRGPPPTLHLHLLLASFLCLGRPPREPRGSEAGSHGAVRPSLDPTAAIPVVVATTQHRLGSLHALLSSLSVRRPQPVVSRREEIWACSLHPCCILSSQDVESVLTENQSLQNEDAVVFPALLSNLL